LRALDENDEELPRRAENESAGRKNGLMRRKYVGAKRSIEAWSEDRGRSWSGTMFDRGSETKISAKSLPELDALASKHEMRLVS